MENKKVNSKAVIPLQDKLEAMARFMGGVIHDLPDGFGNINRRVYFLPGNNPNPHCNAGTYKRPIDLEYHIRYDWLHRVWEKFRDLEFIAFNYGVHKNHCTVISNALVNGTISEAFDALYNGIEFVNGLKK